MAKSDIGKRVAIAQDYEWCRAPLHRIAWHEEKAGYKDEDSGLFFEKTKIAEASKRRRGRKKKQPNLPTGD